MRLLCPWDSPGNNTGVGAMPSSTGSSQPRDRTRCLLMSPALIGGFFTTSATWETINALEMKTSVLWSTGGGSQALGVGEPYSVGPVWPLGPSGYLVVENEDVGEFAPTVLAWRIPGTVGPGGLPSMGSHRVRHD